MSELRLQSWHAQRGAVFHAVNGQTLVDHHGQPEAELAALTGTVAALDLGGRGRLRVTGEDARTFLNGQLTNDLRPLREGQGCYAFLTDPRARVLADLNVLARPGHTFLLDLEPGQAEPVRLHLTRFVFRSRVKITLADDLALFSLQGPSAAPVVKTVTGLPTLPEQPWHGLAFGPAQQGLCVKLPRFGADGHDLWVPATEAADWAERITAALAAGAGSWAGWQAGETARIAAGIPRWGADYDAANLAPETGLEALAISYSKGCYCGQEVIARVRTYGQVAKAVRPLELLPATGCLPKPGDRLAQNGREVGLITSVAQWPVAGRILALGTVRRESNQPGTVLELPTDGRTGTARIL
jgi:folate-binding protein YgfZ